MVTTRGVRARQLSLRSDLTPPEQAASLCIRMTALAVCREVLGSHQKALDHLGIASDELVSYAIKAQTDPANTTVPDWAGVLVGGQVAAFLDSLGTLSVYAQLAALSPIQVQAQTTKVPTRDESKRIPYKFVAENQPIPVGGTIINAAPVGPHKLAGISILTAELARLSQFETMLRAIMQEDASIGVDGVLLDDAAGDTVRPAGLLNGITPIVSTGDPAGDVAALLAALGNARRPAIIANNKRAAALGAFLGVNPTLSAALGLILAPTVPDDTLVAVDAWDFSTTTGDSLDIEVNKNAVVHLEDSAPVPIVKGETLASPVTSLWQQDLIGYRLLWPVSWTLRRTGAVAAITDAAW